MATARTVLSDARPRPDGGLVARPRRATRGTRMAGAAAVRWMAAGAARRRWPLALTVVSVAAAMAWSLSYTFVEHSLVMWRVPGDIWSTLRSAEMVTWGDFGGIYSAGTGLVSFPGAALLLVPVALVCNAFGLSQSFPWTLPHPTAWLVLGPYEVAVSSVALFAADALAERVGVGRGRRIVLGLAGAGVLFTVDALWGHPEDAVAVGLLLYATVFALDGRVVGAGWLCGMAVAVQPLVLLGLPVLAAVVGLRHLASFAVRAALPAAVVVGIPLLAAPAATLHAIVDQPNFPLIDHVTPWTALAPRLPGRGDVVAGGPGRLVALALAAAMAPWVARHRHRADVVVWALAGALALRVLTESVLDPFYLWPPLALGLVGAAGAGRLRLAAAAVVSAAVAAVTQLHMPWVWWWGIAAGGVLAVVALAAPEAWGGWRSSSGADMPLAHEERGVPVQVRPAPVAGAGPGSA